MENGGDCLEHEISRFLVNNSIWRYSGDNLGN